MELLCQHQIEIKNGVFLVSAYGIEHHSPRWIVNILTTTQFSLLLLAVTIIPTQFYLRYRLLCGGANHRLHLICSLSISILASLWLGILSLINRWDAQKRGTEYYERMLGDEWRDENNKTKFLDAIDLQDRYALCYYASGTIIIAGSYSLALYFGYKSIHAVQPVPSESSGGHGKTEKLKKAFTRNLIVQAVCSYLFFRYTNWSCGCKHSLQVGYFRLRCLRSLIVIFLSTFECNQRLSISASIQSLLGGRLFWKIQENKNHVDGCDLES
ncbi:hypothetical protein M3Y94_00067400 [Aphelenchoides besseyi]|nr:hypothetical protein M3Y94_00067400 [Aphelenchoides besseyi]